MIWIAIFLLAVGGVVGAALEARWWKRRLATGKLAEVSSGSRGGDSVIDFVVLSIAAPPPISPTVRSVGNGTMSIVMREMGAPDNDIGLGFVAHTTIRWRNDKRSKS